jgi:hypothetical protein
MRIATALFTLVSLLAVTRSASADSPTSTDEARHQAGHAQYQMRMPAMSAMPAPAMLPAVPSSTDDFRALAGARQTMTRPAAAPVAMPAGIRVTSTDEARVAAGQNLYTRSSDTMAVAPSAMNSSAAMR